MRRGNSEVFMGRWLVWQDHGDRPGIGGATIVGPGMNGMWRLRVAKISKRFIEFIVNLIVAIGL